MRRLANGARLDIRRDVREDSCKKFAELLISGSAEIRPVPSLLYERMFRQLNTILTTVGDLIDDMLVGDADLDASEFERWQQEREQRCSAGSRNLFDDGDVLLTAPIDGCDGGRHYASHMPAPVRRAGEVPPPPIDCDTPVHHQAGPPSRSLPL
jgi:hypothetical protein